MRTLTGVIDTQINGIKTPAKILIDVVKAPAEILIGVVKAPAEVVEISTSTVVIPSEVVYRLREIFELSIYGLETATKDAGIRPNPRSPLAVY